MFSITKLRSIVCLRNYSGLNKFFDQNNQQFGSHLTTNHKLIRNMASDIAGGSTASCRTTTHTNRLINEKSPYLQQHATNPVDWYPWCEEAIQRAKNENKLIFLSVGYSTCHWCHVMEKESFENSDVAKVMNEHFINIKVDREERPDIDKIYMMFVVMISGSGGWPMSVWLTPDLAPITAGTYFPPQDRWGQPGFVSVLKKLAAKWSENGPELMRTGKTVISTLQKNVAEKNESGEEMTAEGMLKQAVMIYKRNFDDEYGGWGREPKFPEVSKLNFLLHAHFKNPKDGIADMVLKTLQKIAEGGIHDHIFGGFSRYSVDKKWHIPHFEKMLYDQGQLLVAYSNAYRLTKDKFYLDVCEKIVKYVCKDLQHPKGGFFAGEDADSLPTHDDTDKIEGSFYAWEYAEIEEAFHAHKNRFNLTIEGEISPFDIYKSYYNIAKDGNVEPKSDPHGHLIHKNILYVRKDVKSTAAHFKISPDTVQEILNIGNEILYEIRCKRPRPHLDTKIICAWNGLLLSGLSKLACISESANQTYYLEIAKKLTNFMRLNLYDSEKKILYRSCYGEGVGIDDTSNISEPIEGFLDDYTFFIKGLLDYYVATLDVDILHWANELQHTQDKLFWDDENGGYFYSQANSPNVIVRLKDDHDGAEPAGNSMAVHNLIFLNSYYEECHFKEKAQKILEFFSGSQPFGYVLPHMLSGLLLYDSGMELLVVVGPDSDDSRKLFNVTKNYFIPGLVPVFVDQDNPDNLTRKSALQFKMIKSIPTVYLCHNFVCQLPITDPAELESVLSKRCVYKCDN